MPLTEIFKRLTGGPRTYGREYDETLLQIANLEARYSGQSDIALTGELERIKSKSEGSLPTELIPEFFALVRELARRKVGLRAFDVQILGALTMNDGNVAEMATGEGKTLVAVFPAAAFALVGGGAHILTVNDYLARRDATWMGPIYESLGLSVGVVQQGLAPDARRRAYAADVTYATANEVGFDFLRDHLVMRPEDLVQRPFNAVIVDEADSILIDEARIPLVVAGGSAAPSWMARRIAGAVEMLEPQVHFEVDQERRNVNLTDAGLARIEQLLGVVNLFGGGNEPMVAGVNLALHAEVLLDRDVDYLVKDGAVALVDEFKGRVAQSRRWPDGLQAAIEAKEGVEQTPQGRVLSSMTLLSMMSLYRRRCGMTGTAAPTAREFLETYEMKVVIVPTNKPCIRDDLEDLVFKDLDAKQRALVQEVKAVHATARPILVGTSSVEESEELASKLRSAGVECEVLNARDDEREAEIIAQAGSHGAVTISTNMAGRGTDIKLGGDPSRTLDEVRTLDGLYVIGTNRHQSRRIDDQLRGRAGRQGDPGSSRFFISLQDDLMTKYGVIEWIPRHYREQPSDDPIEDPAVAREVDRAQRVIEAQNFTIRARAVSQGNFLEKQRQIIHNRRDAVLHGEARSVFAEKAAERFRQWEEAVGHEAVAQAERQILLAHIDNAWEEHLARMADLREGVHLVALGGLDPGQFFRKASISSFDEALRSIDDRAVETFIAAKIDASGIDLADHGLARPSSTWTYLVTEPFGTPIMRLFKGLKHRIQDLIQH